MNPALAAPEHGCAAPIPDALLPGVGGGPSLLPRLIRLVYNAGLAESTGGICILLPDSRGIDQLAAILWALAHLPEDSSTLAADQIRKTFEPGQKVRVLPDGFVYRVAEAFSMHGREGYFLQFLDAKRGSGNGRFGIWGEDLRRLEPTERSRPLGPERKLWSRPVPTTMDRICGTRTLGNHALMKNRVVLLGSRADFETFVEKLVLLPGDWRASRPRQIGEELPWGSVASDGSVYIEHPRSTPGEPLIAATRNLVSARACSDVADPGTRLFVSRWLEGAIQNFQLLSRIADRQRVVLLLDACERDRVGLFRKDGWTVWEPASADLLASDEVTDTGVPCLDRNIRAARREARCHVEFSVATSQQLSHCYRHMRALGDAIGAATKDEDAEVNDERLEEEAALLWNLFFTASSWICAPDRERMSEFLSALDEARLNLAHLAALVPAEVIQSIRGALDALKSFSADHDAGVTTPKGNVLIEAIGRRSPALLALGGSRERNLARVQLDGIFPAAQIISVAELREHEFDGPLIGCSLLARKGFARLLDPCPAETIELVGYDFEREIYSGRLSWRERTRARLTPDAATRERLGGFSITKANQAPAPPPNSAAPQLNPIETIARATRRPRFDLPKAARAESDETCQGRLCRFSGCSWAVFTPGHLITVLSGDGGGLQRKYVDDLAAGDHVLLREKGDKDVIRLIAEDMEGVGSYAALWGRAQRWRDALRAISTRPLVLWERLRLMGLHRDPVTIRYWLFDDGVIGPRSQDDISIIVETSGGKPDEPQWAECWDAISRLRSLHMRAGMRLTDILEEECRDLACDGFEHEQALELSLGLLWLVRVDEIQPNAHWPAGDVNHLEWGNVAWREERLRSVLSRETA